MSENDYSSVWQGVMFDLRQPDIVWQLATLAACLVLAKLGEGVIRRRSAAAGGAQAGDPGWQLRVAFPAFGWLLVLLARTFAQGHINLSLLSLALPLLASLAIIRLVFYVLRHSFLGASWLGQFERVFATLVWGVVALHISGFLPELIAMLKSVNFSTGKQQLSLWTVLQGIGALLVTMLVALWLAGMIERRLKAAAGLDGNLREVMARLSKALLLLLAVLIGLPMVGIDLTTLSVFGGALGVGLGFGLQKIASNYVSGFIILLDDSIRLGNVITVGNDRGEVMRITTRYTVVKNRTGIEALVPNEMLVSSVVLNETHSDPQVRVALPVQVSYGSDLDVAIKVMADAALAQPRVLHDPEPNVLLKRFADSGIDLEMRFWVRDPENGLGRLCSAINMEIWRGFKANDISIPFPQREVRLLGGDK